MYLMRRLLDYIQWKRSCSSLQVFTHENDVLAFHGNFSDFEYRKYRQSFPMLVLKDDYEERPRRRRGCFDTGNPRLLFAPNGPVASALMERVRRAYGNTFDVEG